MVNSGFESLSARASSSTTAVDEAPSLAPTKRKFGARLVS